MIFVQAFFIKFFKKVEKAESYSENYQYCIFLSVILAFYKRIPNSLTALKAIPVLNLYRL